MTEPDPDRVQEVREEINPKSVALTVPKLTDPEDHA